MSEKKQYPKLDWEKLDGISRKRMDKIEEAILGYLELTEWEIWENDKEVNAYNIAFTVITNID